MDNFDRVFRAGKKRQTLTEAVRVVLEDGVTRAMCDAVRLVCAGGEGCGGPYLAGFLIPQVKRFAGWIADRVVGPGSEAVFAAVQCPGTLAAGFADHKTKLRIANHINPRGRGGPAGRQFDDVFAPIGAKAPVTIVELQVTLFLQRKGLRGKCRIRGHFCLPSWRKLGQMVHRDRIARHLIAQRSICSYEKNTRRCLQQGAFLGPHLVTIKDVDSAALVQPLFTVHPADQAVEHPIQLRAVIGLLAIEDHHIHHKPAAAQVFVHLQGFAHQVDLFGIVQLYQ